MTVYKSLNSKVFSEYSLSIIASMYLSLREIHIAAFLGVKRVPTSSDSSLGEIESHYASY